MDDKNHLSWYCDEHTSSELYSRRFEGKIGKLIIKRQNDLLLSFLGDVNQKTILDVGAGHGQLADTLVKAGGIVTVYGSSDKALEKLKHLTISNKTGPLYPLPFKDKEFDIVVSFRTFPHVPDWKLFLTELCRISKKVVAFDFVTEDLLNILKPLLYNLKLKKEPGTRDYTLQKKTDIEKTAEHLGFYFKNSERQFVLPLVIHRIIKMPVLMPIEYAARITKLTKCFGGPVVTLLERK